MANNFLKQLQNVVETGKLQGITNIRDLYNTGFANSGISYKDFKKQMHDYKIYGNLGKNDMARLSGMYYGSKNADFQEGRKAHMIDRDNGSLVYKDSNLAITPTLSQTITPLNIPIVRKTPVSMIDPNSGPIYASESTAAFRNYSTGTDQNPRLVAGNGNGPGQGFSRQDKRGIGPDNTLIVQDQYGTSYVGNNQISGGNLSASGLDYRTLDQLGLIDYSSPSVTRSINIQNEEEYGKGYDDLTYRQQVDFSNWRKMHGGKGTVEEYLKSKSSPGRVYLTEGTRRHEFDKQAVEYLESRGIKPVYNYQGGINGNWLYNLPEYKELYNKYFQKGMMLKKQGGTMNLNKFQQGGKTSSQQDAVMQFVKALAQTLQADPQQVIQAAQQNPEALKSAVQVYQESKGDIQKAAQAFSQALQSKAQAAKHGAKLNYLKFLKNKCAEDEELYYFKKGGSVGCGCKKKEQGGELKEKKESTVSKFKKACGGFKVKFMAGGQSPKKKNLDQASKDSIEINDKQNMELMSERPGKLVPNPKYDKGKTDDRAQLWVPDRTKTPYKKEEKVKKDCGGSKMKLKKGDKVKSAGTGCIAKFKMHKQGGSLNGIPFIRKALLRAE